MTTRLGCAKVKEISAHMKTSLRLNECGFYEVTNKPAMQELTEYYQHKYFRECSSYKHNLLPIEIKGKQINSALLIHALDRLKSSNSSTLAEIGFGEGFLLQAAKEHGYNIKGVDFSTNQILDINSSIREFVQSSPTPFETLQGYASGIGILCLKNVLEHVINPVELINNIYRSLSSGSLLAIEVPNDFSDLQKYLSDHNLLDSHYWISPPDHLSYFTEESLSNVALRSGFVPQLTLGSFPIEIFLLGEESNYNKDPARGKSAHHARCLFDAFIFDAYGVDALYHLYTNKVMTNISRSITCIYKKP